MPTVTLQRNLVTNSFSPTPSNPMMHGGSSWLAEVAITDLSLLNILNQKDFMAGKGLCNVCSVIASPSIQFANTP